MTWIHNYNPRYVRGLKERGMLRRGDGLKITQHFATPEEMRFNTVARRGGALYELARETVGCFYVDRLQGGTFISRYPFDLSLADEYDRITDGGFLGFQLHESGTTRALDHKRIEKQLAATGLSRTAENILYAVRLVSKNKEYPHFSNGYPEEYAALTPPTTRSEYVGDLLGMWKDRQRRLAGRILNCDAGPMLCGLEKEADVETSFIEVGAQTGFARTQFALRRGVSRSRGKRWGVYLEPWARSPCTAYLFMRDRSNEWYLDASNFLFQATDGSGGSSLSLARRIMYYSLFAGADYFSEEWGQANTFYEWESFTLSPYGEIKRDFLADLRRFGGVRPYVPIAAVIPREFAMFSVSDGYPDYPNDVADEKFKDLAHRIHAYFDDGRQLGGEDYIMAAGGWGSLFDVIYDDSYPSPQKEYELLIDFSGRLCGENVADGFDRQAADAAIGRVAAALPFSLEDGGALDYQLFSAGAHRYLALYNHKGVTKTPRDGETQNAAAAVPFSLTLRGGGTPRAIPLAGEALYRREPERQVLHAGEMALYEIG